MKIMSGGQTPEKYSDEWWRLRSDEALTTGIADYKKRLLNRKINARAEQATEVRPEK